MAVTNFIQTIWSKKIQDDLELKCKLVDNCLRQYEGDCKYARSVKILGVGEPTISAYTGTVPLSYEAMSDKGQTLTIDQQYSFSFLVDDINQAQSVPGLSEKYQEKAVHGLAVKRDSYIASLIQDANKALTSDTTVKSGKTYYTLSDGVFSAVASPETNPKTSGYYEDTATVASAKTQEGIKKAIDEAIVTLRERNFDEEGVIEITPAVYNLFKNELITLSTNNPEYIKKGIVGMYDDFKVIMSNGLAKDSTHAYCDVRGTKAIAFAGQINEVEAGRHQDYFADYIRGLDTFGAKVIDASRIQVVKVPV